jgi:hypothetical protein
MINSDPTGVVGGTGLDRISLDRRGGGTGVMEVNQSIQGELYVVGFVSEEALGRIHFGRIHLGRIHPRTRNEDLTLFSRLTSSQTNCRHTA